MGLSWSKATEANNHHVDTPRCRREASVVPGIFITLCVDRQERSIVAYYHADCLMLFQHADFVTCVDFHPTMDDFFEDRQL